MVSIDKNMKKNSWLRQHFTINKKLLPLKFTLFFFSASAFSILPYLTIHMKDIGIKVEHIALMYAVLPFTIFLGKYVDLINQKKKENITAPLVKQLAMKTILVEKVLQWQNDLSLIMLVKLGYTRMAFHRFDQIWFSQVRYI